MQKRLWQAQAGVRHRIGMSRRPALRAALVGPIAVVMAAMPGCVPPGYRDIEYAVVDEKATGTRRPPTSKLRLSLPKPELLNPQGPPDCEAGQTADAPSAGSDYKPGARIAAVQQASAAADLRPVPGPEPLDREAEMALRVKLEYERACYRQAEIRVRERLRQLQGSVADTIKSIDRAERPSR